MEEGEQEKRGEAEAGRGEVVRVRPAELLPELRRRPRLHRPPPPAPASARLSRKRKAPCLLCIACPMSQGSLSSAREGYNGKFKCLEKKKIIEIHEILKRAEISRFKKNLYARCHILKNLQI